jgi:uncharacterized membrane protein YecN with MAPEG domain
MEPVPALFAGAVLGGFGAALLAWSVVRLRRGLQVTAGGGPASAAVSVILGAAALLAGVWCLTQV